MSQSQPLLTGVEQTSLITLHVRAVESLRPDALLRDEKAVALVDAAKGDLDFVADLRMDDGDRVAILLRTRQFDRIAQAFMARRPGAPVVHLGCGLDARFERVDDGRVEWFDVDLPDVADLRRQLVGGDGTRHHLVAGSMFDDQWREVVAEQAVGPPLFLAEGVFMYCQEAQLRTLLRELRQRFPGSEIAFDAFPPLMVRLNNLRLGRSRVAARYRWGLRRTSDVEGWADGVRLLDRWYPFDLPEPRLARYRWLRHVPIFRRVIGVYHYQLGPPTPG